MAKGALLLARRAHRWTSHGRLASPPVRHGRRRSAPARDGLTAHTHVPVLAHARLHGLAAIRWLRVVGGRARAGDVRLRILPARRTALALRAGARVKYADASVIGSRSGRRAGRAADREKQGRAHRCGADRDHRPAQGPPCGSGRQRGRAARRSSSPVPRALSPRCLGSGKGAPERRRARRRLANREPPPRSRRCRSCSASSSPRLPWQPQLCRLSR